MDQYFWKQSTEKTYHCTLSRHLDKEICKWNGPLKKFNTRGSFQKLLHAYREFSNQKERKSSGDRVSRKEDSYFWIEYFSSNSYFSFLLFILIFYNTTLLIFQILDKATPMTYMTCPWQIQSHIYLLMFGENHIIIEVFSSSKPNPYSTSHACPKLLRL